MHAPTRILRRRAVAWQAASRVLPLPGLQGHDTIPRKGDTVTVYVKGKDVIAFKLIMPNGIVIDQAAI